MIMTFLSVCYTSIRIISMHYMQTRLNSTDVHSASRFLLYVELNNCL